MGGYFSGRRGGRPTADMSLKVDIAHMIRMGQARPGQHLSGSLSWTCGGEPAGSISYIANMVDLEDAWLELSYTRGKDDAREHVKQRIALSYTKPHYGGRRWWMICPFKQGRAGILYLPNGGDRFASRAAWQLGYRCQRLAHRDRPFEPLFRLQRKLGSNEGWEAGLRRPKGMWHRTFDRHFDRYVELDGICGREMMGAIAILNARLGR
jgi:hypothetical protein